MQKLYEVEIEHLTPIMVNNPANEADDKAGEGWETRNYTAADGSLYFPAEWLEQALATVGAKHTVPGQGKSRFKKLIWADVQVEPRQIPFPFEYVQDKRRVVIKSTGGSVIRSRPRFDEWGVKFNIRVTDPAITKDSLQMLLEDACWKNGFGEHRPEKGGKNGRAKLISLTEIKA